jgi:hypothetical protein
MNIGKQHSAALSLIVLCFEFVHSQLFLLLTVQRTVHILGLVLADCEGTFMTVPVLTSNPTLPTLLNGSTQGDSNRASRFTIATAEQAQKKRKSGTST